MPAPSPEPAFVLRGHTCDVQALCFVPCGAAGPADAGAPPPLCLFAGDADGHVKLWDLGMRNCAASWRAHPGAAGVTAVGTLPGGDGGALLTQGRDGALHRWQARSGAAL